MSSHANRPLAKGQIWTTGVADIEIMALGKRLIHYKITKQFRPKGVSVQISGIQAMANYLKDCEARLVRCPSNN
jgi:hypothetical protein